jgi:uncharacterized Zn finger protein
VRPERGDFPPSAPLQPAPEHGIRARRFGRTWWGRRWIGALERLGGGYGLRLRRGRTYARGGRVHDLRVTDRRVEARVTGTRPEPYTVSVRLAPLSDEIWARAVRAMASRAAYAARLLSGEMPPDIDETFRRSGGSLFPVQTRDLTTECSCPDWANPCKHVAAVHYVLAEFLDRDPFLLFELRGRGKDDVLAALRRLRAGGRATAPKGRPGPTRGPAVVALTGVSPEQYGAFREPVDELAFHIEAPPVSGAILRQLGSPPAWGFGEAPRELLHPAVARAAALARELAFGGAADTPD